MELITHVSRWESHLSSLGLEYQLITDDSSEDSQVLDTLDSDKGQEQQTLRWPEMLLNFYFFLLWSQENIILTNHHCCHLHGYLQDHQKR